MNPFGQSFAKYPGFKTDKNYKAQGFFLILELQHKAVSHDFATLTSSKLVMLMTSRQFTSFLKNFFVGILNKLQTSIPQSNGRATRAFFTPQILQSVTSFIPVDRCNKCLF